MEITDISFYTLLYNAICLYDFPSIDPSLKPRDTPQEELDSKYDFIIVGGGIAGCVLANRLSEIAAWSVILLEAGKDETPHSLVPLLYPKLFQSELDWGFRTVKQKHVCQETEGICHFTRGKVLGGMSVTNSMLHVRGNRRDFDLGSDEYGVEGWRYRNLLPFFIKSENATGLNLPYSKYRGYVGPLLVNYPKFSTKLEKYFIKAGKEYGYIERDYNAKYQENTIAYPQLNVDGHIRHSAARAYLYPIIDRPNLVIIKNTFCTKILIDAKSKRALGVEYRRDGKLNKLYVRREVIISAGPVNSPKLLMLSGIGLAKELNRHGINCIANLPVGNNLKDQLSAHLCFKLKTNLTLTTKVWKTKEAILQYAQNKSGPLASNGIGAVAYNGKESDIKPPSISYSFHMMKNEFIKPQHDQIITIICSLLHPNSSGTIRLKSSDPNDHPLIDPNYLAKRKDYITLWKGIKDLFNYMRTPTMQKLSPILSTDHQPKCANLKENEYIHCIIKNYLLPRVRPVSSTTVGAENNTLTVVTDQLNVKGFSNLRVVGSSIMSVQITGYSYGCTYAVAERAVPLILKDNPTPSRKPTTKKPTKTPTTRKTYHPTFQEASMVFHNLMENIWENSSKKKSEHNY